MQDGFDKYIKKIKKLERQISSHHTDLYKFDLLCDMIADLQSKDDLTDIYKYIVSRLHNVYPDTLVMYISIDEESEETCLEYTEGLEKPILKKIISLSGFNPVGKTYKLLHEHNAYFRSGNFVEFQGDLNDFSGGEFPPIAAKAIQKLIGLHKIYTIGILKDESLLGAVHFLTFNKTVIPDRRFISIFVKQAGIIIQKKKLDINLKESEKRTRLILRSMPDMMFIQNIEGEYLDFYIPNNVDTSIPPKVSVGQDIYNVLEKEVADDFISAFKEAQASKQMQFLDYSIIVVGSIHHYETRVICYDKNKFLSIVTDVTERKIAKQKIVDQNTKLTSLNKDKDKFISILAHDLKSPFSSLLGLSQLLSENIRQYDIDKIEKQVNAINSTAKKAYQLLQDILIWSSAQSGKIVSVPEKINFGEICHGLMEDNNNRAQSKDITLKCSVRDDFILFADVNLLKTVMRNLISNAIKFTHKGGSITVNAKDAKNETIISVADTGVGIAKDMLPELFSIAKDQTTKGTSNEEGTGLGLQICKEFVEKMGGEIWVESEEGKGSVFYFTTPK